MTFWNPGQTDAPPDFLAELYERDDDEDVIEDDEEEDLFFDEVLIDFY